MGPVVGAAVFTGLKIGLAGETNYWRIILGAVIIASVVAFPQGIVGFVKARTGRGEA